MNKEELYQDEDAYVKAINWPKIMEIMSLLEHGLYNVKPYKKNDLVSDDINNKTNITYSYEYNKNCYFWVNDKDLLGKTLTLSCTDGRKVIIGFADGLIHSKHFEIHLIKHYFIQYKLEDKNITFEMSTIDKESNLDTLDKVKIYYNGLELKSSTLRLYNKLTKYGKKVDMEKYMKLHKDIVDKLFNNIFTDDELNMFSNDFKKTIDEARRKEEWRIFAALVGDGISR